VFIKLNLYKVYNLIRIKKGEEWKIAFKCKYNHYEYQVMPFGLINALVTYMRIINDILKEYLNKIYITYLNNILVYLKTI
jgi:hypothetical protein